MTEIKILRHGDAAILSKVAPGVFDRTIDPKLAAEFLADTRHHLAAAIEDGEVVAMASAVHHVHPDKPPQLWINEVAVAPAHQSKGLGKAVLSALFDVGKSFGCTEAWVLTSRPNIPAMRSMPRSAEWNRPMTR